MEMEAKRIAELPLGTVFEKKGSYAVFPSTSKSSPPASQTWLPTQRGCGVLVSVAAMAATASGQDGARKGLDRNQAWNTVAS